MGTFQIEVTYLVLILALDLISSERKQSRCNVQEIYPQFVGLHELNVDWGAYATFKFERHSIKFYCRKKLTANECEII